MKSATIIRAGLWALGSAACLIGSMMILFGAQITGDSFAVAHGFLFGTPKLESSLSHADIDSELRFYAVFWIAYGWITLQSARASVLNEKRIVLLLMVFFAGGLARALSWASVGAPHPLFQTLMTIELVLPVFMIALMKASAAGNKSLSQ